MPGFTLGCGGTRRKEQTNVKGKIFLRHHVTKAQEGVEVQLHAFINPPLEVSDQIHIPVALPSVKRWPVSNE
jgi:hypothetical protein